LLQKLRPRDSSDAFVSREKGCASESPILASRRHHFRFRREPITYLTHFTDQCLPLQVADMLYRDNRLFFQSPPPPSAAAPAVGRSSADLAFAEQAPRTRVSAARTPCRPRPSDCGSSAPMDPSAGLFEGILPSSRRRRRAPREWPAPGWTWRWAAKSSDRRPATRSARLCRRKSTIPSSAGSFKVSAEKSLPMLIDVVKVGDDSS